MTSKNKFGFAPLESEVPSKRRSRSPGPMGTAVRDTAETLTESTEAKVEQRRRNADDARQYRQAQEDGRVLINVPLSEIRTDDLPRDRIDLDAVAVADEMEELKSSIQSRGQKEPIEIYRDKDEQFQLKKGWRRLTALKQLLSESGDQKFSTVMARVEVGSHDRVLRYVDMVEENVVREDLTFAEMAQVALAAAGDPEVEGTDPAELVTRLYGALHKTKRSYIRSFVSLLVYLGDDLKWPKAVPRNLGVDVARAIGSGVRAEELRAALSVCGSVQAQTKVLNDFLGSAKKGQGAEGSVKRARNKFEFFVGKTKVTARDGELRIVSGRDFAGTPKGVLEEAIKAFEEVLKCGGGSS